MKAFTFERVAAAEDAARFYAETFPDSSVDAVHKTLGDIPSGKEGDAWI